MEQSDKPKKKIFSIFCCFSMNDKERRKRKEKFRSSISNKTNITDQNISIKVNDFLNHERNSKILHEKEEKIINTYMIQDNKNSHIENKKNEIIFFNKKEDKKDNYLTNYNNNKIKENKNLFKNNTLNKTIEENNTKLKLSVINNNGRNNNYLNENLTQLNISNIKINKNYIKEIQLSNKEEINIKEDILINNKVEETINEKKDDMLINPIPIKQYQTNIIDKSKTNISTLSNKKENKIYNYTQKNINIYDNNDNYCPIIKDSKKKQKNIKNDLLLKYSFLTGNNAKEINKNKKAKINIKKNKNSNLNKIFNNSNIINYKINMNKNNISILHDNKNKIKNDFDFDFKLNTITYKKNKSYIYNTNIFNSSIITPKKIKYFNSVKLINKIDIEKINILISQNKKKSNIIKNIDENKKKIFLNLNKKTENNNKKNNENNENNIKLEKKEINIFKNESISNKYSIGLKKKINKLPLTSIGKKIKSMNDSSMLMKNNKSIEIFNNVSNNLNNLAEKEIINKSNHSKINELKKDNQIFDNNNIINYSLIKKESKEKIKKEDQDNKDLEEEIKDEKECSKIKIINDSIISNYIMSPLINMPYTKSISQSIYSKSEFKDNLSNINDISNNKGGIFISGFHEAEIEITNENGKDFKSFFDTPRTSGNYYKRLAHKNIVYNSGNKNENKYINGYIRSISTQISLKMKNIIGRINFNEKEIEKTKENIVDLDKKIKEYEESNKIYNAWIEKEEAESEILNNMLIYLNFNNINY